MMSSIRSGDHPNHDHGSPKGPPVADSSTVSIQQTHQLEVRVVSGRCMGVITPAVVYKVSGGVHDVPENTTKSLDDYVVPGGFRREGALEAKFVYSLGFLVRPTDSKDKHCKCSSWAA